MVAFFTGGKELRGGALDLRVLSQVQLDVLLGRVRTRLAFVGLERLAAATCQPLSSKAATKSSTEVASGSGYQNPTAHCPTSLE